MRPAVAKRIIECKLAFAGDWGHTRLPPALPPTLALLAFQCGLPLPSQVASWAARSPRVRTAPGRCARGDAAHALALQSGRGPHRAGGGRHLPREQRGRPPREQALDAAAGGRARRLARRWRARAAGAGQLPALWRCRAVQGLAHHEHVLAQRRGEGHLPPAGRHVHVGGAGGGQIHGCGDGGCCPGWCARGRKRFHWPPG